MGQMWVRRDRVVGQGCRGRGKGRGEEMAGREEQKIGTVGQECRHGYGVKR